MSGELVRKNLTPCTHAAISVFVVYLGNRLSHEKRIWPWSKVEIAFHIQSFMLKLKPSRWLCIAINSHQHCTYHCQILNWSDFFIFIYVLPKSEFSFIFTKFSYIMGTLALARVPLNYRLFREAASRVAGLLGNSRLNHSTINRSTHAQSCGSWKSLITLRNFDSFWLQINQVTNIFLFLEVSKVWRKEMWLIK